MKIERTKNASRNILYGLILKLIQVFLPFLMRSVMTYFMGIKYLGLNSLFTSVLQVLNLAELGVGSAMVYSMYKPISEDDHVTICALMRLYRLYYRFIGLVVLIGGLVIIPVLPKLISGEVPPDINIYVIYLLNLSATVLSYWLFAYKNSLLNGHQRQDVASKVTTVTNLLQYALQFLVLCLFKSYYLYLIVILLSQIATNIITSIVVSRMYPSYHPEGKLDEQEVKQINQRIRDLFTSKIGSVVLNSADTIVISAFLGLTSLAIYQNYYFIITSVIGFVAIIFNACTAGIGNSLIVETKEKNFKDLSKFTFLISWIAGVCSCCFICMFQPFMELWMGKEHMLPFGAVICLTVYYYLYEINQLLITYKDAGGIWRQDRFRPLITSAVNLGMNLFLVQFWGIYGVILSTVIAFVSVGMPWLFHNLFTLLFDKQHFMPYFKNILFYFLISALACLISCALCFLIPWNGIIQLILCLLISIVVSNVLFLLVYRKRIEFKEALQLADRMTKGKIKLLHNYE